MKSLFIALGILLGVFTQSVADDKFADEMKKTLSQMAEANSLESYLNVANRFERIAQMNPKEWLPLYYAGFSYVMMSQMEKDTKQKDIYLDKALTFVENAKKISANESELYALEGFIDMMKITVEPMSRGAQYSGLCLGALKKAEAMNENNPRTYYIRGLLLMNMPEAFGGGKSVACPELSKAKAKFESFEALSELHPKWGQKGLTGTMKSCE